MADNNKVAIDAAYFAEPWSKANEADKICRECTNEHTADEFAAIKRERDDLKAKLDAEYADKSNLINELNETRELNRKCCDDNERLKEELEQERMNKCDEVTAKRLAAAERCIEELEKLIDCKEADDTVGNIIRAYREAKEAKK